MSVGCCVFLLSNDADKLDVTACFARFLEFINVIPCVSVAWDSFRKDFHNRQAIWFRSIASRVCRSACLVVGFVSSKKRLAISSGDWR
jgi:hypothetical protein